MLQDTRPPRGDSGAQPWRGEPNRVAWRDAATGLQCMILRGSLGALCGYVRVPRGHPLHGVSYQRRQPMRLDVHGGLTFSGCFGGRRMKRGHWFGFDCAHHCDVVPGIVMIASMLPPALHDALGAGRGVYRTIEYVRNECESLAAQLARKGSR